MLESDLEFLISQYLDGTLPADEKGALLRRVETDADARKLLEEYQRLEDVLKAQPVPELPLQQLNARIAIAACLVIASIVGVRVLTDREGRSTAPQASNLPAVVVIEGPRSETAAGEAVVEIQLTPAPAAVQGWRHSEVVVSRPSRVIIASGDAPHSESDSGPF